VLSDKINIAFSIMDGARTETQAFHEHGFSRPMPSSISATACIFTTLTCAVPKPVPERRRCSAPTAPDDVELLHDSGIPATSWVSKSRSSCIYAYYPEWEVQTVDANAWYFAVSDLVRPKSGYGGTPTTES
jgi:hypothetical protein